MIMSTQPLFTTFQMGGLRLPVHPWRRSNGKQSMPQGPAAIRTTRHCARLPRSAAKLLEIHMPKTTPEQNKAILLEAFDTLFNRRDYAAAQRFWSDRYIQHSAHIAPGREGLFNLPTAPK